jgi:hypothetical protein
MTASANQLQQAANLHPEGDDISHRNDEAGRGNAFGAGGAEVLFGKDGATNNDNNENSSDNNNRNWSQADRDLDNLDLQYLCPITTEFPSRMGRDVGMYLDNGTTCQIFSLECIEQYVTIAGGTLSTSLETFPHPLNCAPVRVAGLMPALFCLPAVLVDYITQGEGSIHLKTESSEYFYFLLTYLWTQKVIISDIIMSRILEH